MGRGGRCGPGPQRRRIRRNPRLCSRLQSQRSAHLRPDRRRPLAERRTARIPRALRAGRSTQMTATHPSVVFLMYHELALPGRRLVASEPGYVRYVLDAAEFAWQMRAIRDLGFRGIGVRQALDFPSQSVAITFDDGCETDLLSAAPVLKQLGFGATFYVVAGW